MKTRWQKPELVVLYRGRPDENLLTSTYCKNQPYGKNGADQAAGIICQWEHGSRAGQACNTYSPS